MERRKQKRIQYETFISHDILSDEIIHTDKMYNFSKDGLYFESDQNIHPGDDIYIGIGYHPHANREEIQIVFGVEVIWRRDLKNSPFRFGIGSRFINSKNSLVKAIDIADCLMKKVEMIKSRKQTGPAEEMPIENGSRKYSRKSCRKRLVFTHGNRRSEGWVTSISRGGAFIQTASRPSLGDVIELVFNRKHSKGLRIKGWIVRFNSHGVGVSFERRSGQERRYDLDRRTGLDRRSGTKKSRNRCDGHR